jgi:hypothetical protein
MAWSAGFTPANQILAFQFPANIIGRPTYIALTGCRQPRDRRRWILEGMSSPEANFDAP